MARYSNGYLPEVAQVVTISIVVKLIVVYNVVIVNQPFSIFVFQSGQRQIACQSAPSEQTVDSDVLTAKDGLQLYLVLLASRVIIYISWRNSL
jgi:hypothetical protein